MLERGDTGMEGGRKGEKKERRDEGKKHSWAQRKLSPLNIFLSINGPLLS